MDDDAGQIPWSEVGTEDGKRLVSTSDELSVKMKEGLAGVSGPGIPDFEDRRWRYEFCILRMFWMWYVVSSPKLTTAGATKPLLDAYHRGCYETMVRAGLIENSGESLRVWEDELEERFVAYKAAYEQVHARPDFSLRVTGRGSVGWLFALYLFPGREPDPRLVLLLNEFGSMTLHGLAEMFKSLEVHYRRSARSRPPFLKRVYVIPERVLADEGFPYDLPFVRDLDLSFKRAVTYLVGENGSGKSTLIEAIAEACDLPVSGGGRNEAADRHGPEQHSALGSVLRPSFSRRPKDGYFF